MNKLVETSLGKLKIIKESNPNDPNELPKLKLQGIFSTCEVENANGRKYKKETLENKIINDRCTPEKLSESPLFGEVIHPSDELTGEINPEKITHRINFLRSEGDNIVGEVEIIPETPAGKIMQVLIEKYGAVPGISSRAFGRIDGDYVDNDSYKFVTYDLTFNPSNPGSFLNKITESTEIKSILKECSKNQLLVINESFKDLSKTGFLFSDTLLEKVEPVNLDKPINNNQPNKTKMEDIKALTEKVSSLSAQLGENSKELSSIKETSSKDALKIKELTESLDKVNGFYSKSLKVIEGLKDKYIDVKKESEKNKSLYSKSLVVAEGIQAELGKVNGYYHKALGVLETIRKENISESVKSLVEKELGSFSKYKTVFNGITDVKRATEMVKAIKEAGSSTPTSTKTLRERKEIETNKGIKLSDEDQRRVDIYS